MFEGKLNSNIFYSKFLYIATKTCFSATIKDKTLKINLWSIEILYETFKSLFTKNKFSDTKINKSL